MAAGPAARSRFSRIWLAGATAGISFALAGLGLWRLLSPGTQKGDRGHLSVATALQASGPPGLPQALIGGGGGGSGGGTEGDGGFARALLPRRFHFPADHGAHPAFRTEWWYFTGNLEEERPGVAARHQATSGGAPEPAAPRRRRFGFQLTFFRIALAPPEPDGTPARTSGWAAREVYLAHFAVTDVNGRRFHAFERWERAALGLAGASLADPASSATLARSEGAAGEGHRLPFRVWVGDWSVEEAGSPCLGAGTASLQSTGGEAEARPADAARAESTASTGGAADSSSHTARATPAEGLAPAQSARSMPAERLAETPSIRLHAAAAEPGGTAEEIGLDLRLLPLTSPVLEGDHGLSRKSAEPGNASYYYSLPRLAASGTVRLEGSTFAVSGLAWMDREWSTSALGRGEVGWDWFALQLSGGTEIMLYRLRTASGGADPASGGTLIEPGRQTRLVLSPTSEVPPPALLPPSLSQPAFRSPAPPPPNPSPPPARSSPQPVLSPPASPLPQPGGAGEGGPFEIRLEETSSWHSPASGARYPAGWHLVVPGAGLDLRVRPVLADQELALSFRYWEGAVEVTGMRNGQPLSGRGYVELTGYADEPGRR